MNFVSRIKFLAKIVTTIALVGIIFYTLDSKQLVAAVSAINTRWLLVGIISSVAFVVSRILKWIILTRSNGLHAPTRDVGRTMLFSLALGIVTPGRFGEMIVVRPYDPSKRLSALLLYVYDRLGELCVVLACSIPALIFFFQPYGLLVAVGFTGAIVFALAATGARTLRTKLAELLFLTRMKKFCEILSADFKIPVAYWAVCMANYLLAYILVVAFILGNQPITDWSAVLLLPLITLSNLISITVGGLGVREGLAASLLPMTNVSAEVGAASFFLSFVFTRVVPGLVGLAWVASTSRNVLKVDTSIYPL
jgi:glycosyltransferase 2 family protein